MWHFHATSATISAVAETAVWQTAMSYRPDYRERAPRHYPAGHYPPPHPPEREPEDSWHRPPRESNSYVPPTHPSTQPAHRDTRAPLGRAGDAYVPAREYDRYAGSSRYAEEDYYRRPAWDATERDWRRDRGGRDDWRDDRTRDRREWPSRGYERDKDWDRERARDRDRPPPRDWERAEGNDRSRGRGCGFSRSGPDSRWDSKDTRPSDPSKEERKWETRRSASPPRRMTSSPRRSTSPTSPRKVHMLPRRSPTPPLPPTGLDESTVSSQLPAHESPKPPHSPLRPVERRVDEHIPERGPNIPQASEPGNSNNDIVMSAPEDITPGTAIPPMAPAALEAKIEPAPIISDQQNSRPIAAAREVTASSFASTRTGPSLHSMHSTASPLTAPQVPTRPSVFAPPSAPRNFGNPPSGPRAEANLPRGPRHSFSSSYVPKIRTEDTAVASKLIDAVASPMQARTPSTTMSSISFKKPESPQVPRSLTPILPEIEIPPYRLPHEIADERERLAREVQNMNMNSQPKTRWEKIKDLEKKIEEQQKRREQHQISAADALKACWRATWEVELANIDLRSAEARRQSTANMLEKAKAGALGPSLEEIDAW